MPLDSLMVASIRGEAHAGPALCACMHAVQHARDRAAFAELFRYFAPRLRAFMRRGGAADDVVDELVQETMLTVWRRADTFDPTLASVQTWVYTIARNKRIDALRRTGRPQLDPADPALLPDPEPMPDRSVELREEAERMRAALARLPQEHATLLQLAYYENRSQSEIGRLLGLPLGTVKSRTRLALERLRKGLRNEGLKNEGPMLP